MKKITLLFTFLAIALTYKSYAQYGCASAVVLTNGYTATNIITPGTGGAEDWNSPNPSNSCASSASYWDDDVYLYTYTAGGTSEDISMTIFTRNGWNGIGVFTTCSGTLLDDCIDSDASGSSSVSHTVNATLTAGQTVYIGIGQWGSPNDLDFDVTTFTVTPIVSPPNCTTLSNPIDGAMGVDLSGDLTWNTASGGATGYKLTVGTTSGGTEVVSSVDVGNVTTYNIGGLTASTTYYVTVVPYNGNGNALGCVEESYTTGAVPVNNDCINAIALTPGAVFGDNAVVGTLVLSTDSGEGATSCGSFGGGDVWYSVVVPADGNIDIETNSDGGSTITDTVIQVYSGACGALVSVLCNDDGGPGAFSLVSLTGRTPGETLYLRVWEYGGGTEDTFKVSAYNATLSIGDLQLSEEFKFYPNPVNDVLNISAKNNIEKLQIVNMLGQVVKTATPNINKYQLIFSDLSAGIYLVKASINNTEGTFRIVKK